MKVLTILVAALSVTALYAGPSYANRPGGFPNNVSGGVIPSECAAPDAKTKHPGWFHDGGYCVTPELGTMDGDRAIY